MDGGGDVSSTRKKRKSDKRMSELSLQLDPDPDDMDPDTVYVVASQLSHDDDDDDDGEQQEQNVSSKRKKKKRKTSEFSDASISQENDTIVANDINELVGQMSETADFSHLEASSSSKKMKKKRKRQVEAITNDPIPDQTNEMQESEQEDLPLQNGHASSQKSLMGWPRSDIETLVTNIRESLPPKSVKKYTATLSKIKWQEMVFNDYSADDLKSKWLEIQYGLRTFRTLKELISDAKDWVSDPFKSSAHPRVLHPEYPKRPAIPFFRFFAEKRADYVAQHPQISRSDLSKKMGEMYAKLSDRKKQKYIDAYEKDVQAHQEAVAEFQKKYPDVRFKKDMKKPMKTLTPFECYAKFKLGDEFDTSDATDKSLVRLDKEWNGLDGKEKVKFIRRSECDRMRYESGMDELVPADGQDGKSKRKFPNLTNKEQKLLDEHDKRPTKPPANGYSLYYKELTESGDLPEMESVNKRNQYIGIKWKELNRQTRIQYADRVKKLKEQFEKANVKYLRTHPWMMEQQLKSESSKAESERMKTLETVASDAELSQRAFSKFQEERLPDLRHKHGDQTMGTLLNITFDEWNEMELLSKEKYFDAFVSNCNVSLSDFCGPQLSLVQTQMIQNLNAMQPAKPPRSGYTLFSKDCMKTMDNIDPNDRMLMVSNEWNNATQAVKDRYHDQYKEALAKYQNDLTAFKSGLKPDSLQLFETFIENKSSKSIQQTVGQALKRLEVLGQGPSSLKKTSKRNRYRKYSAKNFVPSDESSDSDGNEADAADTGASQESQSDRTPVLRSRIRALKMTPVQEEPLAEDSGSESEYESTKGDSDW